MAFKIFLLSRNAFHSQIYFITNVIVGDSLTESSNNMKFSTQDQDNDGSTSNCAEQYKTAGWFNNCFTANINGLHSTNEEYGASYLTWSQWNVWSSLKTFQMMIRPHA